MKLIPAIDIIDGKCVRLTQGNYSDVVVYSERPLNVAKKFESYGFKYLHLVDLDGAKTNHIINHKILYEICKYTNLIVDFSGGIKSEEDVKLAFSCGASKIAVGSIAISNKQLFNKWLHKYGANKIILSAAFKCRNVKFLGWQNFSEIDILDFITFYKYIGIKYVYCTNINKDGLLQGVSTDIYSEILNNVDVKLVASGGVSSINDILQLKEIGCDGVIIGKALYDSIINIKALLSIC